MSPSVQYTILQTHVKQLLISMVCILCYRGQGVGSAVVKHLLETPAAMTTDVYLVTLGRSIPFYKKAGFTLVPIRQIPRCVLFCPFLRSFLSSFYCLLVSSLIHSNWCPSPRLNYIQSCLILFLTACAHMRAAAGEMLAADVLLAILSALATLAHD